MDAGLIGLLPRCPPGLPGVAVASPEEAQRQGCVLTLGYVDGQLALASPSGRETPLAVDFCGGRQGYRLAADRVRHERLIKALGGMPDAPHRVVDGTGGLGRDALVMAQAGFDVDIVEQSPIVHALLADGLSRLQLQDATLAARIRLYHADSSGWLQALSRKPFAVYLDPMFPQRQKSAAIKKELLWLQYLEQPPDETAATHLLDAALAAADRRVVVKRPRKAPALAARAPSHALEGKTVRFDVYLRPR